MKTKPIGIFLSLILVCLSLFGCAPKEETTQTTTARPTPANPVIRCSTTTSVNDSGLMAYLEPLFEAETGYDVQITSNGTGAPHGPPRPAQGHHVAQGMHRRPFVARRLYRHWGLTHIL